MSNERYVGKPQAPQALSPFDGVLLVDKAADWTSHDVVAKVRGQFRIKKVGHGGTLDPAATGLLVLLLGKGTKLSQRVMGGDKVYEGTIRLGRSTSTQDAEGEIVEEGDYSSITREQVEEQMKKMLGDQMQIPPMVSAVKIDGVPLYKRARKGEEIERKSRFIHIYNFDLLDGELPEFNFRVKTTKGTYVRTLCHDIGEALGCKAHLKTLRRTVSGCFNVADAIPMEDLKALRREALEEHVIPITKLDMQEL